MTETIIPQPVIHEVETLVYRDVPADLTTRCKKTVILDDMTYGEALAAWAIDRAAVETCNGRLAGIESLGAEDEASNTD